MKFSINLLQESQKLRARLKRIGLIMQTVSFFVLIALGVGVFILLSYTLVLSNQQKNISEQVAEKEKEIESYRLIEVKQFLVQQKLMFVVRAIDEYGVKHELVTDFYTFVRSYVQMDKLSISKANDMLIFDARALNVFELINFLEALVDYSEENKFSRAIASGFSRGSSGSYSFSIILYL